MVAAALDRRNVASLRSPKQFFQLALKSYADGVWQEVFALVRTKEVQTGRTNPTAAAFELKRTEGVVQERNFVRAQNPFDSGEKTMGRGQRHQHSAYH
jgi:hypothetical protein